MLVAITLSLILALGADEPLVNGGFEAAATVEQPVPGWLIELGAQNGATTPASIVELSGDEKSGGRQSLHLAGDSSTRGWRILKQEIEARPGGKYHLEAMVKTDGIKPNGFGLDNCYVGLIFFDAEGEVAGRSFTTPNLPNSKWSKLQSRVTAGPTARRGYVYVFLSMLGDLWIDDLELEIEGGETLPEPETVMFEDFEKAKRLPSKWKKYEGATNGDGGTDSIIEVDLELGASDSTRSLRLSGDAGTMRWWSVGPELKAKAGELWRLSAKVKADDVRREEPQFANLTALLVFLDRKGEAISRRFGSAGEGSFDWKEISAEGVSPKGTKKVRAHLFLSMSGTAWFDDVELTRLEDVPLPYGDWSTVESPEVVLRHSPAHAAGEMKAYHKNLESSKKEICRQLEVEFNEPITVFLYKDLDEGRLLTGGNLDFADPENRKVHQRRESYIAHEMVHVIAHNTLQYSGTGLLGEGIAVWLDGRSPARHHGRAMELLKEDRLPTVQELLDAFRDQDMGYPAAGSFTGFLIDAHGLELFKEIYPLEDPSARAKELVGKSFVEMEPDWHAQLAKFR